MGITLVGQNDPNRDPDQAAQLAQRIKFRFLIAFLLKHLRVGSYIVKVYPWIS